MAVEIKMPGGEMAKRPLNFFWVVDSSGSMTVKRKMEVLNYAIQSTIPEMQKVAADNTNAQLLIQALQFNSGAQWMTTAPVKIEDYKWTDLKASGGTSLGKAFDLLAGQLTIPPMSDRALPPVIVLLSDGQPTDSYKEPLKNLLNLPWGKKSVRIAIAIGEDANRQVLEEFTGNPELVLDAKNPEALVNHIKWASTVAKQVSQPASRRKTENESGETVPASLSGGTAIQTPVTIDLKDPKDFGPDIW